MVKKAVIIFIIVIFASINVSVGNVSAEGYNYIEIFDIKNVAPPPSTPPGPLRHEGEFLG